MIHVHVTLATEQKAPPPQKSQFTSFVVNFCQNSFLSFTFHTQQYYYYFFYNCSIAFLRIDTVCFLFYFKMLLFVTACISFETYVFWWCLLAIFELLVVWCWIPLFSPNFYSFQYRSTCFLTCIFRKQIACWWYSRLKNNIASFAHTQVFFKPFSPWKFHQKLWSLAVSLLNTFCVHKTFRIWNAFVTAHATSFLDYKT